jgi:hypothetical protein
MPRGPSRDRDHFHWSQSVPEPAKSNDRHGQGSGPGAWAGGACLVSSLRGSSSSEAVSGPFVSMSRSASEDPRAVEAGRLADLSGRTESEVGLEGAVSLVGVGEPARARPLGGSIAAQRRDPCERSLQWLWNVLRDYPVSCAVRDELDSTDLAVRLEDKTVKEQKCLFDVSASRRAGHRLIAPHSKSDQCPVEGHVIVQPFDEQRDLPGCQVETGRSTRRIKSAGSVAPKF